MTRNLVVLALIGLLVLAVGWVAGNMLLARPVNALVAAARRLARGELRARTGLRHGRGELGRLAAAFDGMAESIEQLTSRTELILSSAGEGICGTDVEGRITFANPAAARTLGHEPEELVGRVLHDVLHPESHRECVLAQALRTGASRATTDTFCRKDGALFPADYVCSPRQDGERMVGAVLVFSDATTRVRAEAEMERHRAALVQREKVATLSTLLTGVAHELNNPLAAVMGQVALLREELREGRTAEALTARVEKLAQAAERCVQSVQGFLALARQRVPERRGVDLNRVVLEALDLLAYQLRRDDVDVALDLAEGLPPVWADPHQLHQVVVNLVANAQYAMRQGLPPWRLRIGTRLDPARARLCLEVADSGPGIPDAIRGRLFEPFVTTKPPGEGTGLGLAFCQRIVEGHGGRIVLVSGAGQGAVFRIELPPGGAVVTAESEQAATG